MDTIVFGDYTMLEIIIAGGVIFVLLYLLSALKKIFKKDKSSAHAQSVECFCGWKGQVSKHAGRCPKCNTPLGDQRAKY
jgi:hypothetical protein